VAIVVKPVSEEAFQRQVIALARLYGWRVAHFRSARTAKGWRTPVEGDKGFMDLVLARSGVVIIPELKTDVGIISADQQEWLDAIGSQARVWRPRDWAEIELTLKGDS